MVEDVEGAEAVRVGVLEVLELGLEEDVGLGEVAEDEGDFGLVGRVGEDAAGELVHSVVGSGPAEGERVGRGGGRKGVVRTYGVMPVPPAIRAI